VAIAVPNMEKAVAFYKNALNAKSISEKHVRDQNDNANQKGKIFNLSF
jgi:hypothetical protein